MKTTKSILVFITAFILGYFFLSSLGCMFFDSEGNHFKFNYIIGQPGWALLYTLFIGWWLAGMITHEYYDKLSEQEFHNKNAYK
jgi:hypothetical protein